MFFFLFVAPPGLQLALDQADLYLRNLQHPPHIKLILNHALSSPSVVCSPKLSPCYLWGDLPTLNHRMKTLVHDLEIRLGYDSVVENLVSIQGPGFDPWHQKVNSKVKLLALGKRK